MRRQLQQRAGVAIHNPAQIPKTNLLRLRNGDTGVSAISRPDASPWWKMLLLPTSGPTDQFFQINAGQELSIYCQCPTDSMIRFLWNRFNVSRKSGNQYFLSRTATLEDDDIDDDRASWDYLGDISIRVVFDSLDSRVLMDWTPLSLIQGNNEFGRVRFPMLTPKSSVITFQFRNTSNETKYVSGYVHGWRIRL